MGAGRMAPTYWRWPICSNGGSGGSGRMAERRADWLSVAEARERVLAGVAVLPPERRALEDCLGHVLAETITSPIDLPPWDNSAMDGYAVRAEDVRGASERRPVVLRLIDDVPAGRFAS